MTIQTVGQVYNPITGVFGTGNVQFFTSSGTWAVPQGIGKVRVRVWGAGGPYGNNSSNYGGGGGGGFAMKTIYDLTGVTSVSVSVGAPYSVAYVTTTTAASGGTSSFGSYCSATGGSSPSNSPVSGVYGLGGTGIGGDINTSGGYSYNHGGTGNGGGGGCGSVFGNGGNGVQSSNNPSPSAGGAGAGHGYSSVGISYTGGSGFFTNGGVYASSPNYVYYFPQATAINSGTFPLDFVGTGGGGAYGQGGANGGGGGYGGPSGGFPGGGNGYSSANPAGGGLVIVEW